MTFFKTFSPLLCFPTYPFTASSVLQPHQNHRPITVSQSVTPTHLLCTGGGQYCGPVPLLKALQQRLGPLQGPSRAHPQKGKAAGTTSHRLRCVDGMVSRGWSGVGTDGRLAVTEGWFGMDFIKYVAYVRWFYTR